MRRSRHRPTASSCAGPGKVIPFQRPGTPPTSTVPDDLLRATEATLRATDVYARLLTHRLELARRANAPTGLGNLDGAALLRATAAADALTSAAADALAQIDRQLAARAQAVAEIAREEVPDRA